MRYRLISKPCNQTPSSLLVGSSYHSRKPLDDLQEDDLWGLDLSRETADDAASMKKVLRITSKFKGSMAKIVIEERDER